MPFIHCPLAIPLPELDAVTSEDGNRIYTTPEGNQYPSITTVLHILSEAAIEKWRAKIGEDAANKISEHARERGTALHLAFESFIKNEDIRWIDPKTRVLFNQARLTLRRINNVVAQEVPLYSDRFRIAGRCDVIADFDGIPSVIDFKTADRAKKREWIEGYFQQATGYSLMWEERTGRVIDQLVIIITGDDGSCAVFIGRRGEHIEKLVTTINRFNNIQACDYSNPPASTI